MLNNIFMMVLCILAVYGAVKFVFYLYGYFLRLNKNDKIKRHTVLFFKDNCEEAEINIRETIPWMNPFGGDLIAVDMGSKDETMDVLRRLEREYDVLRVMDIDEYIRIIRE